MTGAGTQAIDRLDQATLERARAAVPLAGLIGKRVKLHRSGREWTGLCPFHSENTPSFCVVETKGFYHCFGCGAHGDAIRWLQEVEGLEFRAAVESLLGGTLPDARRPAHFEQRAAAERRVDVVSSMTAARWVFGTSGPAKGEIVERYLESRGLDPGAEFLPGFAAIERLRFHPRCPVGVWRVGEEPEDHRLTAPAMVEAIGDAEGANWGVRVTFLAPDGRGKAELPRSGGRERPSRKIFGKIGGYAAFLTPAEAMCSDAPLIVGEGSETTWAFAQGFGAPCRAVAALSLGNLQGGAIKLRDGSLPLWNLRADPERPPFVLPCHCQHGSAAHQPSSPCRCIGEVIILADADMKPLRQQKVQLARRAKPVIADISGLQRAEICGALAAQAWRRAGASSVRAVRPRMGMDFNDTLQSAAA